jgi:hypothetical protein
MARERRAALVSESAFPADTAHPVYLCTACQKLGLDALGFAGGVPLPGDAVGFCHALPEFAAALNPLFGRAVGAPQPQRDPCTCGAPNDASETVVVVFFHAMAGTGAELMLEGVRPAAEGEAPHWRVARVPLDGAEEPLANELDDAAVQAAFGRPVSLVQAWHRVLERRAPIALVVHPGQWIFAAAHDDPELRPTIEALIASPDRRLVGLDGAALASPAWAWIRPWLQQPQYAQHMGGMVIDLGRLRHAVAMRLRLAGLTVSTRPGGWTLLAQRVQTPWLVELETVAREALRGDLTIPEAAAAATSATLARIRTVEEFLQALSALRDDVRYRIEDVMAFPVRADGREGRPFNLLFDPFRTYGGPDDLVRDLAFHFDDLKPYADPMRICPCGAALMMATRLVDWPIAEALIASEQTPATLEVIADDAGNRQAAVLLTLECDRHVRYLSRDELEALDATEDDVPDRVRRDLPFDTYTYAFSMMVDSKGRRALAAHGPKLGSVALHDELISGLHHAIGVPLTTVDATAWAVTPNFVVLMEPEFEPHAERSLIALAERLDQQATGTSPSILQYRRIVRLNAVPRGRFTKLASDTP